MAEPALHRAHASAPAEVEGYRRRRPEETALYRCVERHWPAFREQAEEQGGLPKFVEREVEEYLRCGILEHGCLRLACARCGFERLVGFSCKRRGFCPSCLGRRRGSSLSRLMRETLESALIRKRGLVGVDLPAAPRAHQSPPPPSKYPKNSMIGFATAPTAAPKAKSRIRTRFHTSATEPITAATPPK